MKNIAEGTKKQLFYCALTLLVSLSTMSDLYFDSGQNGLKTLIASCALLPFVMLIMSGISAFRLANTDIYISIISAAILIYILWLLAYLDTFIVFGLLEAVSFFVGLKIGSALRKLKKK